MARKRGDAPRKTALWKDVWRSIAHSKGRFVSIMLLMALGSFALVGLFVAGPDMRATGEAYFDEYGLADLTVMSDYGLDADDVAALDKTSGTTSIEYGYFKDVTLAGTTKALRVMSMPDKVSQLELVDGRLPQNEGEIAIDANVGRDFPLGSRVSVEEKPNSLNDECVLRDSEYIVVGYVHTPEIISIINMGQSTAGTGSLKGYGVVVDSAFDSDVYMTARMAFGDTAALDPYSNEYRDAVAAHKSEVEGLIDGRPEARLATVKADAQSQIDDGQAELDDARSQLDDAKSQLDDAAGQLADAKSQLDDAAAQIADAKGELASTVAAAQARLDDARGQLDAAAPQLASARIQLEGAAAQISSGEAALSDGQSQLAAARDELAANEEALAAAKGQLDDAWGDYRAKEAALAAGKEAYDANWPTVSAQWEASKGAWAQLDANRDAIDRGISQCEAVLAGNPDEATAQAARARLAQLQAQKETLSKLDELKGGYERLAAFGASYDANAAALADAKSQLDAKQAAYDANAEKLEAGRQQIAENEDLLASKSAQLSQAKADYVSGQASYSQSLATYNDGMAAWRSGVAELASSRATAEGQIADAERRYADGQADYADGRAEYEQKLSEYDDALPDALQKISDGEADLTDARARLAKLGLPSYEADTRREALGSEAYKTYDTVSEIVDSLARVFPVLLYLVAAFVTLSTMTRMVEEERINSGTLKALGYHDGDVAVKFVLYGSLAGGAGAVLGIVLGHTLLPWIVYSAYGAKFTLPPIRLEFRPGVTLVALVLAGLCSVLPAALACRHELSEKPAALLLPKPPKGGSKIFLERVKPVWNHLSFTHKVTARNLFRYKQRMLMTVLGVAGAVCMLVAGFGVQHSIQQMGTRQFGQLIKYDMIVAQTSTATDDQLAELDDALDDPAVASHVPLHYEEVTLAAGANNDTQEINLLVPEEASQIDEYLDLQNRKTGEKIDLAGDGVVISERLSQLLGVGVGDEVSFKAADGTMRSARVDGITEMYMGHFMIMSREAYEGVFGEGFESNAALVKLADGSLSSVEERSAAFMRLDAVKSVVQNTALEDQVNTVVNSLDMIMTVLILVATMLAVVIMYNLTNLNVSERMRELSTIKVLGFHSNETTMYIYRETILLTILGVLAGYVMGVALHQYILNVVPPDTVMFNPELSAIEFAVPAVVIAVITVVLYFVELRRLTRVDMLEALKSVE